MGTDGSLLAEYPVRTSNSRPEFIVAGPDGNMWFTEQRAGKIGRISTDGAVREFALAPDSNPTFITAGPDGNLWFIGRANSQPIGIATGWDGNLWFAEFRYPASKIGRMATDGSGFVDYDVPGATSDVETILAGPDGNMWYADSGGNKLGSVAQDGSILEYATPTSGSGPLGLTLGPDQTDIWFAEIDSNMIGQYVFDGGPARGGEHGGLGGGKGTHFHLPADSTIAPVPSILESAAPDRPIRADQPQALSSGNLETTPPSHLLRRNPDMDWTLSPTADGPLGLI
jgi:streptogramin lyase